MLTSTTLSPTTPRLRLPYLSVGLIALLVLPLAGLGGFVSQVLFTLFLLFSEADMATGVHNALHVPLSHSILFVLAGLPFAACLLVLHGVLVQLFYEANPQAGLPRSLWWDWGWRLLWAGLGTG